jgi:hypothetical protein
MAVVRKVVRGISALNTVLRNTRWLNPGMEIVYRELFLRDLKQLGIEDTFYPIGSAANHGLLYTITRAFTQFPIRNVLELGCGQSTLLLTALTGKLNEPAAIRSVEQDRQWADSLRSEVRHEIVVSKLVPKTVRGYPIRYYADGYLDRTKTYDLVIVDGPTVDGVNGTMSRLGCLEVVEMVLAADFIVIVDDAERKGEGMLVDLMRLHFKSLGVPFGETSIIAAKRQHIFSGGKFQLAMFF